MSICLCYHNEQNFLHEGGVCYGTKEKEPCSCGGNPVKCDFYEEVREKYTHQTHADNIRSMNDEELADFYSNELDACPPEHDNSECIDELYAHGEGPYPSDKQCMKCWINWLKQEANP